MKSKRTCFWIILVLVIILSAGCQPPTPAETPTELPPTPTSAPPILTDDGIMVGANLNCPDLASFGYITENVPGRNALVSSPILFRWYYFAAEGAAPDWANVCVPTSFTLYLAAAPDYNITNTYTITPTTVENLTNILMFSHSLSDTLQPHTSYRWMVVGHADGIDIGDDRLPLFQDESAWKLTNNTAQMDGQFQTGPACDPQTISPVILINPPDEAALDTETPFFQWDLPSCSGSAYWLSFDTDPQMDSVDFGWVTEQEGFLTFQSSLQPCVIYYWQVQAGLYSTAYHLQIGDWATASEIRSFLIRSSACPNANAVPSPAPTSPPTSTPTKTPKPTSTPVVCAAQLDQKSCQAHSDICYWKPTNLTIPGVGICLDK